MTGDWRRQHTELHDLYFLPNMVPMIELRRTVCAVYVACMGKGEMHAGLARKLVEEATWKAWT